MPTDYFFILISLQFLTGIPPRMVTLRMRGKNVIICREEAKILAWTTGFSQVCFTTIMVWNTLTLDWPWWGVAFPFTWYMDWLWVKWSRRLWRQHKDHEDDCIYGPKRKKSPATNRVRWVRFAPAIQVIQMPT